MVNLEMLQHIYSSLQKTSEVCYQVALAIRYIVWQEMATVSHRLSWLGDKSYSGYEQI